MTKDQSTWVGLLDIDKSETVAGVSGPLQSAHRRIRVLIRMHQTPLGYVSLPSSPVETLTDRTRLAAETTFAEAIHWHRNCDSSTGKEHDSAEWAALTTCPERYPDSNGAGVTIVVCTRDRPEGLRECLRTLQQVDYDPVEIIVVDNAPSGGATREIVTALAQHDPRIRYTCEPRPGLSKARNFGMLHARYDVVAFTDDDALADSGWPSAVAAGFAADPGAVCVTGLVASSALDTGSQRYFDSRYSWGEAFEPRRYDMGAHRHPSSLYPFSAGIFGTGANFAVRRSVVSQVGGFDPLLGAGGPGRGGEDLDMFLRLVLAGGRICYLPSALIWHRHRAESEALSEQIYSYGYGLGAYLAKHLINGQLPAAMLGRGLHQVGEVARRMRRATRDSQLQATGRRLGLMEVLGVMAGALRYYRASRRASEISPEAQ